MKATLIIEYDEDLRGNAEISVLSKVEPEQVKLSDVMLLGILEMVKQYLMREE
jgi:hypothetical protein